MANENVFRFITLRPPKIAPPGTASLALRVPAESTAIGAEGDEARTRSQWQAAVRQARSERGVPGGTGELPVDLGAAVRWLTEAGDEPLTAESVEEGVRRALGAPPHELVERADFRDTELAVGRALVAQSLSPEGSGDDLVFAAKVLALVRSAAAGTLPADLSTVGEYARDTVVVLPEVDVAEEPAPAAREYQSLAEPDPRAAARDELERLRGAHAELSRLARRASVVVPGDATPSPEELAELRADLARARQAMDEFITSRHAGEMPEDATSGEQTATAPERGSVARHTLSEEDAAALSDSTRQALADLGIDPAAADPWAVLPKLESAMAELAPRVYPMDLPRTVRLGGADVDVAVAESAFLGAGGTAAAALLASCAGTAGVGDLLIVRQKLKAYEVGDFAHVENVLAGESRSREHRRLNRVEETITTETERETEKERDLQSTERDELQTEASKTVQTQMQLDAGLQVSGSYGPAVSFSSNLSAGFSTSTTEAQRKAATYSRELVDKSVETVRERVSEQRVRRVLTEVEEINRHGIDNPVSGGQRRHVRGVYRWLNKIYDAQVFSYGQRMMFDYVVPEPAAFWLYSQLKSTGSVGIAKPQPPTVAGRPLTLYDIEPGNYHQWVAQYQVLNVPPPPPSRVVVTYFDRVDGTAKNNMGRSAKIEIPAGYSADRAVAHTAYLWIEGDNNSFHLTMGGAIQDRTNMWGSVTFVLNDQQKEITIAYTILQSVAFAIGVDVHCEITFEGLLKWRQEVYDAVTQAYLQQKAAYDEQQRITALQAQNPIQGQNPLENVRTVRDELRKWVLMLMTGRTQIARDGFTTDEWPTLDLTDACQNGAYIRFFENAFEWHNMLWVFYPYFWGREARWMPALHFTDPDPDFAAFLKAGAGRVQVPVRPGFERAVAHFMQFGEIWEGQDPPLQDDQTFVPIVNEITENLGKIEGGVPYPKDSKPWEVTIPTSLVILQNLEEVPMIRDMLTGKPVTLNSPPG